MALAYGTSFINATTRYGTTIVWFTTNQDNSQVKLGTSQAQLNLIYTDTTLAPQSTDNTSTTYKHTMKIRGLQPNTKYYYSFGSTTTTWGGGGANDFFYTSVDTNSTLPLRFWVLADYGVAGTGQLNARNAFTSLNGSNRIDAWLSIGDLAYSNGTWAEIKAKDFAYYPDQYKQYSHFPVPGNHDYYSNNAVEYYSIYVLPTFNEIGGVASRNQTYYSYDIGNVHFIALDGYKSGNLTTGSALCKWLINDLENWKQERDAGLKKWCIVYQHYPAYSHGTHDSDGTGDEMANMRTVINPIIESYNVDLVLFGHSHVYERTFFMNGFYGNSSAAWNTSYITQPGLGSTLATAYDKTSGQLGTTYVVTGNGGQGGNVTTYGTWPHYSMVAYNRSTYGSLVIDIQNLGGGVQALYCRAVQVIGIIDEFYIKK